MGHAKSFSAILLVVFLAVIVACVKGEEQSSPPPTVPDPKQEASNQTSSKVGDHTGPSNSSAKSPSPPAAQLPAHSPVFPPPLSKKSSSSPPPLPPVSSSTSRPPPVSVNPSNPPPVGNSSSKPSPDGPSEGRQDGKSKEESSSGSKNSIDIQKCGQKPTKCGSLRACLWRPEKDSKGLVLIFQNNGEDSLNVTVISPPGESRTLMKNAYNNIPIQLDAIVQSVVTLKAGDLVCNLKTMPPAHSPSNIFPQIPPYALQMTPLYGAYAVFLTALLGGGAWVCCKFVRRNRRIDASIPYQQLEMGVQMQSNSVADTDAANGWDQWDDDWDEEEAASRPPNKQNTVDTSANGHISKASTKDGWEDWDD